jgi:hypothetical protein
MGRACFHRIWRVGWLAALVGILAVLSAAPAAAEKRIALVIGNSAYKNVTPLDYPTRDAQLMAETLSSIGFTLVGGRALLDLDKSASAMDSACRSSAGRSWVPMSRCASSFARRHAPVVAAASTVPGWLSRSVAAVPPGEPWSSRAAGLSAKAS